MQYQIGQTVQYNYDKTHLRIGEVVEFDAAANRYRVYWHTENSTTNPTWVGHPNKRTWVRADYLQAAA